MPQIYQWEYSPFGTMQGRGRQPWDQRFYKGTPAGLARVDYDATTGQMRGDVIMKNRESVALPPQHRGRWVNPQAPETIAKGGAAGYTPEQRAAIDQGVSEAEKGGMTVRRGLATPYMYAFSSAPEGRRSTADAPWAGPGEDTEQRPMTEQDRMRGLGAAGSQYIRFGQPDPYAKQRAEQAARQDAALARYQRGITRGTAELKEYARQDAAVQAEAEQKRRDAQLEAKRQHEIGLADIPAKAEIRRAELQKEATEAGLASAKETGEAERASRERIEAEKNKTAKEVAELQGKAEASRMDYFTRKQEEGAKAETERKRAKAVAEESVSINDDLSDYKYETTDVGNLHKRTVALLQEMPDDAEKLAYIRGVRERLQPHLDVGARRGFMNLWSNKDNPKFQDWDATLAAEEERLTKQTAKTEPAGLGTAEAPPPAAGPSPQRTPQATQTPAARTDFGAQIDSATDETGIRRALAAAQQAGVSREVASQLLARAQARKKALATRGKAESIVTPWARQYGGVPQG